MGRFATVMLMALGACFFAPERPGAGSGDAGSDGPPQPADMSAGGGDGGGGGECPADDMGPMPSSMICGTWGYADTALGGMLTRNGGLLESTLMGLGDHADCVTPTNIDFSHGASITFVQPLQGVINDTTRFVAAFDGGASMTIKVTYQSGGLMISATCTGPGGFSSPAPFSSAYRYLKVAATSPGASNIGAYYSADGQTWNTMGTCSLAGTNLARASVRFGATAGNSGSVRTATFDDFKTCTTP